MNKLGRIFIMLLTCCLIFVHCSTLGQISDYVPEDPIIQEPEEPPIIEPEPEPHVFEHKWDEMRGVWVATVFNLDFPTRQNLSAHAIMREIEAIVAYSAQMGINAIFFQVRPTGDAFYESEIFPWSKWLTGTQGEGIPGFDPLQHFIEVAHAHDIELHAWINPYRIIHTATNSSDPETLAENHPVRLNPDLAIPWSTPEGNAGLFLDPGLPAARQLIIDGIEEIIRNYNVDGIHFDDYFYPGTNFNDDATFARYGGGMELDDWRRENVNILIRDVQSAIRDLNEELDRSVRWGISPTAIWMNDSTDPRGVPGTRGQESYHSLFVDSRAWVVNGWVDYIIPQIYWYIGFERADFEAVFNWWVDLCYEHNMELYIGIAVYREVQDWSNWSGEVLRQLEMIGENEIANGSVFFRYEFLRSPLGNTIREFYRLHDALPEREPVVNITTLSVGVPLDDTSVTAEVDASVGFHFAGASNPHETLYMNGEEVTNRTIEGFFSIFVPLESGDNTFTFSQAGQSDVTRVITRSAPAAGNGDGPAAVTFEEPTRRTFATVTSGAAWLFPNPTTTGGSDWMLSVGQVDRVLRESSNGFLLLSNGLWVNKEQVELSTTNIADNALSDGEYHIGTYYDMITWQSNVFVGIYPTFDGEELIVYFGMHTELPPLELPEDLEGTMFSSVRSSGEDDEIPFYAFTIREDARYEGHFVDFEDGELRLHLKKRKFLSDSGDPLNGFVFVLDPGHGGDEERGSGAVGPMGLSMSENHIALANALLLADLLEELGATVHLTRDSDETVTLQERVNIFRDSRPDMFISLHVNNVEETTNSTNISGFTVWYRNPNSIELAETMLDVLHYINPMTNRHRNINQMNLFVGRPQWAPSITLESGFIRNIHDFVWLIDPVQQARYAEAIVDAILDYFGFGW